MGSKALYLPITTQQKKEAIISAIRTAFRSVGGSMVDSPTGISIKQGTTGVNFAFAADINADVNLREVKENSYEIECVVNWKMNGLAWVCLVVGIFVLGILWIVPLLYLFVNPESAYQQALNRVQTYLE